MKLCRDENGLGFTIAGGLGSTPYKDNDQVRALGSPLYKDNDQVRVLFQHPTKGHQVRGLGSTPNKDNDQVRGLGSPLYKDNDQVRGLVSTPYKKTPGKRSLFNTQQRQ